MSRNQDHSETVECSSVSEGDRAETRTDASAGGRVETSRRALLAGVTGLLAAAVADLTPRKAQAQQGQPGPLILESVNFAANTTELKYEAVPLSEDSALRVSAVTNPGIGVVAGSEWGAGVIGASGPAAMTGAVSSTMELATTPVGVSGLADFGTGVRGVSGPLAIGMTVTSTMDTGVLGASEQGAGVVGLSGPQALAVTPTTSGPWSSAGIVGLSDLGVGLIGLSGPQAFGGTSPSTTMPATAGVVGRSESGSGIYGSTLDPAGVGVVAENFGGGLALDVHGRMRLSTSGCGELAVRSRTHQVNEPRIVAESVVIVTFQAEPRPKWLRVTHVELLPRVGFIIHLRGKPHVPIPFAYLVIDQAGIC